MIINLILNYYNYHNYYHITLTITYYCITVTTTITYNSKIIYNYKH